MNRYINHTPLVLNWFVLLFLLVFVLLLRLDVKSVLNKSLFPNKNCKVGKLSPVGVIVVVVVVYELSICVIVVDELLTVFDFVVITTGDGFEDDEDGEDMLLVVLVAVVVGIKDGKVFKVLGNPNDVKYWS